MNARLGQAQSVYASLEQRWTREATTAPFEAKLSGLRAPKERLDAWPAQRADKLRRLAENRREDRLRAHLESHRLGAARVSGIGPTRIAVLRSFRVETADDIDARTLHSIPGFGPTLIGNLLAWRHSVEGRFRFDSSKPVDPKDVARIKHKNEMQALKSQLERDLLAGPEELRRLGRQIEVARQALWSLLTAAASELAHAERDAALAKEPPLRVRRPAPPAVRPRPHATAVRLEPAPAIREHLSVHADGAANRDRVTRWAGRAATGERPPQGPGAANARWGPARGGNVELQRGPNASTGAHASRPLIPVCVLP